jgi:CRP-like cAMP-binding protein
MFHKLLHHARLIKLAKQGDILFKKGYPADHFYFVLIGQILITRTKGSTEDYA